MIVRCQFDESRPDVLLESVHFCSAWDGDDPRLLGKQPGESDLSESCVFLRRERNPVERSEVNVALL